MAVGSVLGLFGLGHFRPVSVKGQHFHENCSKVAIISIVSMSSDEGSECIYVVVIRVARNGWERLS